MFADLLTHGILVKSVSAAGPLEGCLRITIGTSLDNERCTRALRQTLTDGERLLTEAAQPRTTLR